MSQPSFNSVISQNHASGLSLAAGQTLTITLTSDVVGNLLVFGIEHDGAWSSTITDSRQNTWAQVNTILSGSRLTLMVGRMDRPLKAGDKITLTVLVSNTVTRYAYQILDYSNAHLTGTGRDVDGLGSNTNSSPTTGNMTTTTADEVLIGFTMYGGASGAYTGSGSGTTRGTEQSDGTANINAQDRFLSATGTYTVTASLSASRTWTMLAIGVRGSTRWYVDYSKADDTGAGTSWATAKKNLSALSPKSGDTVSMAKSSAPSSLTGTATFTDASTSVATSADQTAVLAAKDMIGPYTGSDELAGDGWWEVSSVTSSTVTLVNAYVGTTRSTVSFYRNNGFDAGSPASSGTNIITTGSILSGSLASPITVTGGYDTGTDTRTGMTHLRVSGATKNGNIQLGSSDTGWVMQYVGVSRCSQGFVTNSNYQSFDHCFASNTNSNGFNATALQTQFDTCYVYGCQNAATAGFLIGANYCYAVNCVVQGATSAAGIQFQTTGSGGFAESCTLRRCTSSYGVLFNGARGCYVRNCTVNNCGTGGCQATVNAAENFVIGGTFSSNGTDFNVAGNSGGQTLYVVNAATSSTTSYNRGSGGLIKVDRHNQTAGSNRSILSEGIVLTNTANARSDTCLELQPSIGTSGGLLEAAMPIPVEGSGTRTVTVYVAQTSTWNGDRIRVGLRQYGAWVQPSSTQPMPRDPEPDWPTGLGTSYTQYTFTFAMSEVGSIELCVAANGSAGSIYVDDIAWT